MTTTMIDRLTEAATRLHEARTLLAHADADLIMSKAQLAAAERRLDELTITLQADVPRDRATNEVQRRAYAILSTTEQAAALDAARATHTANEVRRVKAVTSVRMAEDMQRYLGGLIAARELPDDFYVPPLPAFVMPETVAAPVAA